MGRVCEFTGVSIILVPTGNLGFFSYEGFCAVCEEFTYRFELFPKGECKFSALTHACSPLLQVKLLGTTRRVLKALYYVHTNCKPFSHTLFVPLCSSSPVLDLLLFFTCEGYTAWVNCKYFWIDIITKMTSSEFIPTV